MTSRPELEKLTKAQLIDTIAVVREEIAALQLRHALSTEAQSIDNCVAALKTLTKKQKKGYSSYEMETVPDGLAISRVLRYLVDRFGVEDLVKS